MTLEVYSFFGPELNDPTLYNKGAGLPVGWSIVSTPAPPQGTYWIAADIIGSIKIRPNVALTPPAHVALVLRAWRYDTDFDEGSVKTITFVGMPTTSDARGVKGVGQADGTCKIGLYDGNLNQLALSSTTYAKNTPISLWVHWDRTNCEVFINGVLEMKIAETAQPDETHIALAGGVGTTHLFRAGGLIGAATRAELFGAADIEVDRFDPDGSTAEDEATGVPDNSGHPGGNKHQNWNDFATGGASDGDTTHIFFDINEWQQVSTLTTHTPGQTTRAAVFRLRGRATGIAKTANSIARLKHGANVSEVALPNWGDDIYRGNVVVINTPPGGSPWTQTILNALEAGIRIPSGNDADIHITALALEIVSAGGPPGVAVTEDRRRALIQQVI